MYESGKVSSSVNLVLYAHLTYKDDDLFRNGSVHEW